MRDDDHRALFVGKLTDDAQHLLRELRIQCAGRLVEAEDFRIHGECAGDGDALALSAGEVAGVSACLVRQTDLFQQEHGFLLGFLTAAMQNELLGRGEVAQNGVMREEVIILKDQTHFQA